MTERELFPTEQIQSQSRSGDPFAGVSQDIFAELAKERQPARKSNDVRPKADTEIDTKKLADTDDLSFKRPWLSEREFVERHAKEVSDLITKHKGFGPTFKEREVAETAVTRMFEMGMYQSGVRDLAQAINKNLEGSGSDLRVAPVSVAMYWKHHDNKSDSGLDRYRDVSLYLYHKDDIDKQRETLDRDKAVDRISVPNLETHEFDENSLVLPRDIAGKLAESRSLTAKAFGDRSVNELMKDTLNWFGEDGLKGMLAQLNKELLPKGLHLELEHRNWKSRPNEPNQLEQKLTVNLIDRDTNIELGSTTLERSGYINRLFQMPERIKPEDLPAEIIRAGTLTNKMLLNFENVFQPGSSGFGGEKPLRDMIAKLNLVLGDDRYRLDLEIGDWEDNGKGWTGLSRQATVHLIDRSVFPEKRTGSLSIKQNGGTRP